MADSDKWFEITILTKSEAVEAITAILYNEDVSGVAIEDPNDIIASNTSPGDWDYIDDKLLPKATDDVKVKGYFPDSHEFNKKIESIRNGIDNLEQYGLDKGKGEIIINEVREEDWANAWKQYYKPFKIGHNIIIKPTWEDYIPENGDIIVEIDPGMAFGTGTHETTRMCIELLEEYIKKNCKVFDIGCGSGILSIVSSKLGASKVTGVDIDKVAIKTSKDNVNISGVENVEIIYGNLFDVLKGKAYIIVANIIADVIISITDRVREYLDENGVFICSGIIKDRAEDVKNKLIISGFRILKVVEMGEWTAIASEYGE